MADYPSERPATACGYSWAWSHFNRLLRTPAHGVSSVDGTTLAIAPDTNLPVLLSWLDWLNHNQVLA